jgi:hypothetical protein
MLKTVPLFDGGFNFAGITGDGDGFVAEMRMVFAHRVCK